MNNQDILNWESRLKAVTAGFLELSDRDINRKINADSWSIAQVIEHLITINSSYFPTFQAIHNGTYKTPAIAKLGFLNRAMGRMILRSVEPGRRKRIKTFPIWEPRESNLDASILQEFERKQIELVEWIKNLIEPASLGVCLASPANKNVVYPLKMAFEIIVTHEERHLEQAKEVALIISSQQSA